MKKIFILLIFTLIAQESFSAEDRNGVWLGTFSKKSLTEKYSYWLETQVRYNLESGSTAQVLYRTGLLQKLNDSHGLGYLYAFIQSGNNREHRLTLQHVQKYGELSGFRFSHRARLESRYLEQINNQTFETGSRARYLIRAEQNEKNKYNAVIWNEVFINLNETSWNGDQADDRNRFFIGFKKSFLGTNRVEIGYLNQFIPRDSGDVSEHIATFYLFF